MPPPEHSCCCWGWTEEGTILTITEQERTLNLRRIAEAANVLHFFSPQHEMKTEAENDTLVAAEKKELLKRRFEALQESRRKDNIERERLRLQIPGDRTAMSEHQLRLTKDNGQAAAAALQKEVAVRKAAQDVTVALRSITYGFEDSDPVWNERTYAVSLAACPAANKVLSTFLLGIERCAARGGFRVTYFLHLLQMFEHGLRLPNPYTLQALEVMVAEDQLRPQPRYANPTLIIACAKSLAMVSTVS